MCGISGGINTSKDLVHEMALHQTKRGPDHLGIKSYDNVIFAHNLLAIIGHQEQPVSNESIALTYNGEWYDYKDYYPYETSDTNALLKSITEKGIKQTLNDINGMFAFGVYDKNQSKVYLAVDRFGQKPLYFYYFEKEFAFASSPGALTVLQDKWAISSNLDSYWLLGSTMGRQSIFYGIEKLCAAELLTYDLLTNTYKIERYWEPKYQPNAQNNIEELVFDAINKTKISDVPIHIFLSGGIDSSLLASQYANGSAIHLDSPERIYAQFVADKFNIDLKVISPQSIEITQYLEDYFYQCGEPSMAALIPYTTAKEVSKYGRVAITANGADELFFGYDRTKENVTQKQIDHIFRNYFISPAIERYQDERFGDGRLLEFASYIQYDLNKTLDFASMCHSLEVRSPFLDHRLVECALSIPEQIQRKQGNKTILKSMLKKMGFKNEFLNRPKLGFSLHEKPKGLDNMVKQSLKFCINGGYLKLPKPFEQLSGRDQQYLGMSALGFKIWLDVWKDKII